MSSGVITPEAVLLELPTAGVATRAFARLIDLITQAVLLMVLLMPLSMFFGAQSAAVMLTIAATFVVLVVYPIVLEILWRGRSVGKWLFGLRVVGVDGAPEVPRQAAVRGLVALVDIYVSLGFLALISAMFSPVSQRTGDMAAGTVVIRVRGADVGRTPIAFHPPVGYESYVATLDVGRLDDEDFSLVREFLLRSASLAPEARQRLSVELANMVRDRIGHTLPGSFDAHTWLVCVASAHQLRAGGLLADAAAGLAPLAPPQARPGLPR